MAAEGTKPRAAPWWLMWITEALSITPADRILEIGCGAGALASLICDRLDRGQVTAIDRSAAAIARASARNADHVATGRAVFHQVDLAEIDLARRRFDKIVAVNVSALWIVDADNEWNRLLRHLRPAGTVRLFHRSAQAARTAQVASAMTAAMVRHGLTASVSFNPAGTLCGVTGAR